jgi:hypothetical protein
LADSIAPSPPHVVLADSIQLTRLT